MAPKKPTDCAHGEIVDSLKAYFGRPRHWMLERTEFRVMGQRSGETFAEFAARLRGQAKKCVFGAQLEENLAEQFIAGTRDRDLSVRLLELPDSELKKFAAVLERASTEGEDCPRERRACQYDTG